jgi:hypothetical protein
MADNATTCTAEVNGTSITCACAGCGIAYNHADKKYTILCCGSITTMSAKNQADDPTSPPRPNHIQVNLVGCTRLEAAQLLQRLTNKKIKVDASLDSLQKRVTFKANLPLEELTKKLGLAAPRKSR